MRTGLKWMGIVVACWIASAQADEKGDCRDSYRGMCGQMYFMLRRYCTSLRDQGVNRSDERMKPCRCMLEYLPPKELPELAEARAELDKVKRLDETGQYAEALPHAERALQLCEKALGPNRLEVAECLDWLGRLHVRLGNDLRAEATYRRALQIREATLGKHHPDVATSLDHMAELYRSRRDTAYAEPLALRALQIREAALGNDHPDVAESLYHLALLYISQHRIGDALPLLERSFVISENRLRIDAPGMPEAKRARQLSLLNERDETLYNLLGQQPSNTGIRRLAMKAVLLHKARRVYERTGDSRAFNGSSDQAHRDVFQRLRALRAEQVTWLLGGPGQRSPDAYQARIQELDAQENALEAELAQRVSSLRALQQPPAPHDVIDRVAAALPADGALIEFIAFCARPTGSPPSGPPADTSKVPSNLAYLALILLPSGDIQVANLGPAATIDNASSHLHQALTHRLPTYLTAAQGLYRLVFQPIAPHLGSQRQLFLSPDGELSLVPFAVFHDGIRFLIDTYDLTYLISGKDLLRHAMDSEPSRSVVVIADPDGEPLVNAASQTDTVPVRALIDPTQCAGTAPCPKTCWDRHVSMPGTRQEARAIQRLFPQAQLLMGPAATKQALLSVVAPGILHIGVHGFYLGDNSSLPTAPGALRAAMTSDGERQRPWPQEPLLRAGMYWRVPMTHRPRATPFTIRFSGRW